MVDLVTGAAGFIGQHVVAALAAEGRAVRGLDLLAKPPGLACDWVQGSILDPRAMAEACQGVARVFHLAAIPHFWTPERNAHQQVNVAGTEAVIAAARAAGVAKLLHCSTEAILMPLSKALGREVDEHHAPPASAMPGPYTRSKLAAEAAALAASDLAPVVVNPTAPIGPGDQAMTPPTRMLTDFLAGRYPAFLDCTLNLVDVRDVAAGHLLAAEKGAPGQRYILGGENIQLSRLLALLGEISGQEMPKRAIPGWVALTSAKVATWWANSVSKQAPSATPEGVRLALSAGPLSSARAEQDLGYQPRPLREALEAALTDLRERDLAPR
ncbi:MAG: NAD-dependent epimerase/dehydratase family protein [Pseudomonadota bacterium]